MLGQIVTAINVKIHIYKSGNNQNTSIKKKEKTLEIRISNKLMRLIAYWYC